MLAVGRMNVHTHSIALSLRPVVAKADSPQSGAEGGSIDLCGHSQTGIDERQLSSPSHGAFIG